MEQPNKTFSTPSAQSTGVTFNVEPKLFREFVEQLYNMHNMEPEKTIEEILFMIKDKLYRALREG